MKGRSLPPEVKNHIHLEVEVEWSGSANLQKRWLSLTHLSKVVLPHRCNSKKNEGGIFAEKTSCVTVV